MIPALAALAWGEPRRRAYWETELLNALTIVERGWAQPDEMIGSWAGAMGHTQWMPEVWLHMGVDYDHDGRASPFGKPDDSLAGTARYLLERGKYRRGEAWGCEARLPAGFHTRLADDRTWRSYAKWHELGVRRADGAAFARPDDQVKLWLPVAGGPAFLVGQNFRAVYSYNPSASYTLALVHLGDLVRGDPPFRQQFPGGERAPTLEEVKEIQRRLNEHGFKTDGIDGRTGPTRSRPFLLSRRRSAWTPPTVMPGLKVLAAGCVSLVIRLDAAFGKPRGRLCRIPNPAATRIIAGVERPAPSGANAAAFGSDVLPTRCVRSTSLCRAQSRCELSRPARQSGQLSRQ